MPRVTAESTWSVLRQNRIQRNEDVESHAQLAAPGSATEYFDFEFLPYPAQSIQTNKHQQQQRGTLGAKLLVLAFVANGSRTILGQNRSYLCSHRMGVTLRLVDGNYDASPDSAFGKVLMPLFRVRLFSRSALRADKGRRFRGGDYAVRVSDSLMTRADGAELHDGLLFTVEITSADIHEAIKTARGLASHVADQLSLAHSCAIEEPEPLFAFSLDSPEGYLQLAQVIRNVPELRRIRRPFSDEAMRPVVDLIEKARLSDQGRKLMPRLDRALRYLRRSNLETDPIDKFEDLSNGLQSLEPRLREKYHSPTVFQRDCPSCNQPLICKACGEAIMAPDNFSGVDHLVTAVLGRSRNDARRLRNKRNDIVHSIEEFGSILVDLQELTELAAGAVVTGVLELLGADPALRAKLSRSALGIFSTPELVAVVALHGASREIIEQQKNYPAVRLKGLETVRPNRQLKDTDPNDLQAIVFHVDVENYAGDWDPLQASISLPKDPEDTSPLPQLLIQKAPRPSP